MSVRIIKKSNFGVARSFDRAQNHRIVFPLVDRLTTSGAFPLYPPYTFSVWVYPTNATAEQCVIFMGNTVSSSDHWFIGLDTGKGMLDPYWSSHDRIYTVNSYTINGWHHLAARIISDTDRHMYLNGDVGNKASSTLSRPTLQGGTPGIALGRREDSSPGDPYSGLILHATIFGDAIHEDSVVRLSQGVSPFRIKESEVVWYYSGDDFSDQEKTVGDQGVPAGTTPPTWGVGRSPQIFAPPTVPYWAQGELLPIDITPAVADAVVTVAFGGVGFGDINVNPVEVSAATSVVIGGVDESDVDITPSPAEVVTSKSGPQVRQSSLSISPSAASANTAKVDPDVELNSIAVDPDSAVAAADSIDPTVNFTGINISPAPATVSCSGVDPDVDDAQNVFPTPSTAATVSVDPSLFWGSQSATPTPASAATLAFIDLEYTPAPASAGTDIQQPIVLIGDAIINLYPAAATAAAVSVDPTLYFTSFGQTPDPASAGADSVDPTYYVYGGGYPVVRTTPAVTVPVSVAPTTQQASLSLTLSVAEAAASSVDPTLFWDSTSAYPDEAVAGTESVDPVAGVFFRYFMEADLSLGDWTNELDSSDDLYASIDEDPHDDDDYIQSDWGPEQEAYLGKLERMSEPDDDLYHYVEYRYKKNNTLKRMDIVVRLYQGASVISGWSHDNVSTEFVTQRQVLSEDDASLITDYEDLRLEFEAWERG